MYYCGRQQRYSGGLAEYIYIPVRKVDTSRITPAEGRITYVSLCSSASTSYAQMSRGGQQVVNPNGSSSKEKCKNVCKITMKKLEVVVIAVVVVIVNSTCFLFCIVDQNSSGTSRTFEAPGDNKPNKKRRENN